MRVGLYQKFFTWAMLNLVLLGVITALFIGGVLLFNNNLYSPMLVQRQYRLHVPDDLRGAAIQTRKPMGFGP